MYTPQSKGIVLLLQMAAQSAFLSAPWDPHNDKVKNDTYHEPHRHCVQNVFCFRLRCVKETANKCYNRENYKGNSYPCLKHDHSEGSVKSWLKVT